MTALKPINFLNRNKKAIKTVFQLLGILSIFLIFKDLFRQVSIKDASTITLHLFLISLLLQFFGKCSVALSWIYILKMSGVKGIKSIDIFINYSQTEVGKYLPGNVMHLVSRQIIFEKMTKSSKKVFQCIYTELFFYLISFSIFILLSFQPTFSSSEYLLHLKFTATLIVISLIATLLLKSKKIIEIDYRYLAPAFIGYFIFATCLILSFYYSVNAILDNTQLPLEQYAFSSSLSWLVGFVAPGLPGGIGIRDLVLLKTIESSITSSSLPLIIITFRVVSILGDVFLYLFGSILEKLWGTKK